MKKLIDILKEDWKHYVIETGNYPPYLEVEEYKEGVKIKPCNRDMDAFYKFVEVWIENKEWDELIFAERKCGLPTYIYLSEINIEGEQRKQKYWSI